jgi:hypothetical protein
MISLSSFLLWKTSCRSRYPWSYRMWDNVEVCSIFQWRFRWPHGLRLWNLELEPYSVRFCIVLRSPRDKGAPTGCLSSTWKQLLCYLFGLCCCSFFKCSRRRCGKFSHRCIFLYWSRDDIVRINICYVLRFGLIIAVFTVLYFLKRKWSMLTRPHHVRVSAVLHITGRIAYSGWYDTELTENGKKLKGDTLPSNDKGETQTHSNGIS